METSLWKKPRKLLRFLKKVLDLPNATEKKEAKESVGLFGSSPGIIGKQGPITGSDSHKIINEIVGIDEEELRRKVQEDAVPAEVLVFMEKENS